MGHGSRNGIVPVDELAGDELDEVTRLMERCNQHEGLDLPLYLPAAGSQAPHGLCQFLHYSQGMLTGYLAGDRDSEACGMVHPEYRRRGIGRALVAAIGEQYRQRGIDRWFLICDEASSSGPAFARAVGAQRRMSEYRMEWDGEPAPVACPASRPLVLQPVSALDRDLFLQTVANAFGDPIAEVRQRYASRLQEPQRRYFLAHRDGEPMGTVGLYAEEQMVYITTLGVVPSHRRRGFGRAILARVLDLLCGEGVAAIRIEVQTENERALLLYRSCGFRERTVYSFNEMSL